MSKLSVIIESLPPLLVEAVEVFDWGGGHALLRVRAGGQIGYSIPNQHLPVLLPLLEQRVKPVVLGSDARDVATLGDRIYRANNNYKLAGLALWNPVAWVVLAILDLLGRLTGQPVAALLGEPVRWTMPIYVSSMRRDTAPEMEVDRLAARLAETGARAVKFKVGGRISDNADAQPGRTSALIRCARQRLGDDIELGADANGSYDPARAIVVGRELEAVNAAWFEEPCPWEDYAATGQVSAALTLPVSGGEQDSSLWRFAEQCERRTVDILQPDVAYCGGLVRARRIAAFAEQHSLTVMPHSPATSALLYALHLCCVIPNPGRYLECNADPRPHPCLPAIHPRNGQIELPGHPGLGLVVAEADLARARPLL